MNRYGQPMGIPVDPNSPAIAAGKMLYAYVEHKSGPVVVGDPLNMATTGATLEVPSIFEYTVPANTEMRIARLNWALIDANPTLTQFAGIAELPNGCLLDVVNVNGLSLLDLTGGRPFVANKDFLYVAGIDMVIVIEAAGPDVVKVRFSLFKAGRNAILKAGESIRWTIRDSLEGIPEFRCQVQGTMTT